MAATPGCLAVDCWVSETNQAVVTTGQWESDQALPPVIRQAEPADLDAVTELELGVIHYDAQFGAAIPRPATPELVRESTRKTLERRPGWTWLATKRSKPVGLAVVEPPHEATWIAGLARPGTIAYLPSMYLCPEERGTGTGTALITSVHHALDTRGST